MIKKIKRKSFLVEYGRMDNVVEEIKNKIDIVDFIGNYESWSIHNSNHPQIFYPQIAWMHADT